MVSYIKMKEIVKILFTQCSPKQQFFVLTALLPIPNQGIKNLYLSSAAQNPMKRISLKLATKTDISLYHEQYKISK